MDSKDKSQPQPPATQPPAVGPGTNEEGAAEALAWQKHRERQRRPVMAHHRGNPTPPRK